MLRIPSCVLTLSLAAVAPAAPAAGETPLFSDESTLQIRLEGDWRRFQRTQQRKDERLPATLRVTGPDGSVHELPVEYEARGISRRHRICDFPPIRLYFDEATTEGTPFAKQEKLKLVTWCGRSKRFDDYNLKEFAIYRIFNRITPISFRVRGADIEWLESGKDSGTTRFGFFIEDVDDMAGRNGLDEIDLYEIKPERLDADHGARFALFQYLVGNLDWAATGGPQGEMCCHNAKLAGTAPDAGPLFAVPYDFDATGLVDTHYSAPPEGFPMNSIRERLYRGFCEHNEALPAARSEILALRDAILATVRDEPALSGRARDKAVDYLQEGFAVLADDAAFSREITGNCRG